MTGLTDVVVYGTVTGLTDVVAYVTGLTDVVAYVVATGTDAVPNLGGGSGTV